MRPYFLKKGTLPNMDSNNLKVTRKSRIAVVGGNIQPTPTAVMEDILEKKLEDIATVLCSSGRNKSRLYEDVLSMVERSLFRIALKRSNNIKSAAATYLGINRNTFQRKMEKLGITSQKNS
jgi:DNA-binding protein Fis